MTRLGRTALLGTVLLQAPVVAQGFGDDWLVIGPVGRGGRSAVHTDAIEARIVRGTWRAPTAGEEIALPGGGKRAWKRGRREKGTVAVPRGGHAWTRLESKERQAVLLTTKGHSMVYVNGTPRAGNPYRTGWYRIPILLRKGSNEFLFRCGRGAIQPGLMPVSDPVFFAGTDHTLPDLIVGEATDTWLGIVIVNAGTAPLDGAMLRCRGRAASPELPALEVPAIPPLSVYKCCAPLRGPAPEEPGESKLTLALLRADSAEAAILDQMTLTLRVRAPREPHSRTYRSPVDGSAQYYAVNPPGRAKQAGSALFLSLHGAGVEARGQAGAYSPKSWGHLVAPTNRRPFGFDWEDWGRRDAMDVLDEVLRRYPIDPSLVYLTGHSMGGHGTWHVGVTFPNRFAAIGPSAGWISFWSYGSGRSYDNPDAVEEILLRAASSSDTLALRQNHAWHGIYILHGERDRNVPVREARRMKKELAGFHGDFRYHEQPGAGHWWDGDDEPGAACVDWPPMFDFFARHRLPRDGEVREVDFTTMNPSISACCHFACIAAQERQHAPSRVRIRLDPGKRRFRGTTRNVARLLLDRSGLPGAGPVLIELDEQELEVSGKGPRRIQLWRIEGRWQHGPDAGERARKGPARYGPFKEVFDRDFLLVAGTRGSAEEQRWALEKARYDAETFWYRGNGSVEVILDTAFDAGRARKRNVILYGNASTNAAWNHLLGRSPVQVEPGLVRIGNRRVRGEDLCCLFVRPHDEDPGTLVGVVSGTGLGGMRLTDRLPYFVSGIHYPDVFVAGTDVLEKGSRGVRVAGFFGLDWSVENGDFAWR